MQLTITDSELRPLVAAVVAETLATVGPAENRLNGRIAFAEAEAAELLGVQPHALRDCRLRGEIAGSRVGKRVVYAADDLREFLLRQRIK